MPGQCHGRVADDASRQFLKHPIVHADVEMHVPIEAGTETLDEGDCPDVQSRRLIHAPCVARGAYAPVFAEKCCEVVVFAMTIAGTGKAVGKDAAFRIFTKRLTHERYGV